MDEKEQSGILGRLREAKTLKELEDIRISVVGKKGVLTELFAQLKSSTAIKEEAQSLNAFKQIFLSSLQERKDHLEQNHNKTTAAFEDVSLSLPNPSFLEGRVHPLSQTRQEAIRILSALGFDYEEGPEIETEYYNFDALNFPPHHPARHMHDTFYLNAIDPLTQLPFLLRTHTSTVQVRAMERGKPPFRCMALGRTYRSDSDQTHTPQFHQLEGMAIDHTIHLGHLKWTLETFLKEFFSAPKLKIRFRPSYFPFTEPSLEVDVQCERGKDKITIGTGSDWLEILGCGMIHPHVLQKSHVDPTLYQGFAFGIGLDRLTMLKHGASDLRAFFESDVPWLKHYGCPIT